MDVQKNLDSEISIFQGSPTAECCVYCLFCDCLPFGKNFQFLFVSMLTMRELSRSVGPWTQNWDESMAFLICFLSKAFLAWLRSKSRLIILFRERREGGMMNDDVGSWHKTNVAISEDHLWRNRRTTVKAHQRNSQTSFYQIFLSSCLIARLFNSEDGNSISIVVTGDAHRHAISRRAVESSSYSSATGRISRTSYKTINNLFLLQHRRIMESRT